MDNPTKIYDMLRAAEQALDDAVTQQAALEMAHHEQIAQIVHDIKNPLTGLMGYLSLINNQVAGPINHPTYEGYFQTVERSAKRLLDLCHSLLGEHAGSAGKPAVLQPVDVNALVDEISELFSAQATQREIELKSQTNEALPDLEADPQEIYRALTNLVSNALKFTPRGGRIEIQADVDPQDNTFIMVVRDSGVGMTQEQIDRILSTGLTTVSPHGDTGTGQGLGIVNRIVSGYGGKLDIVSTENRGTRIKLKFPKKR